MKLRVGSDFQLHGFLADRILNAEGAGTCVDRLNQTFDDGKMPVNISSAVNSPPSALRSPRARNWSPTWISCSVTHLRIFRLGRVGRVAADDGVLGRVHDHCFLTAEDWR